MYTRIFGQNPAKFGIKLVFLAKYWHFWPNMGIFGPFVAMLDQITMRLGALVFFSVMWVPQIFRPPQIISKFCPKTAIFAPKYVFLGKYRPCRLIWCPVSWWLWREGCNSQDTYLLYDIEIMILIIVFKGWSTWFREMDCQSSLLTGAVHLSDRIYLNRPQNQSHHQHLYIFTSTAF